jgi:MFS family permease
MEIGAVPFLLPLIFQVGFGLDAFHAGLLALAVFAGNLAMKIGTMRVLRGFGFRRVLLVNGLLNVASILACALLSPATPVPVIAAVLFVGGLTRSMQFSAYNTIAFADIPRQRLAAANALSSTVSQLAMGLGVALGALGGRLGHGALGWLVPAALPAGELRIAFMLVAVVGLGALVDSLRLAADAGAGAGAVGK